MSRWLVAAVLGCAARLPVTPPPLAAVDEITLYRDHAVVTQRVAIEILPGGTTATRKVRLPAGVAASDLMIVDRGGLVRAELRPAGAAAGSVRDEAADLTAGLDADPAVSPEIAEIERAEIERPETERSSIERPEAGAAGPPRAAPAEVEIAVAAIAAGRFTLALGYITDRLPWRAAYTVTTSAARDRATVTGAVAIRNRTGIALRARARLVDAELAAFGGPPVGVAPRELGVIELGDGETRIELLAGAAPRRMRSLLVYDPIGSALDHAGAAPISDPALGAAAVAGRVTESLEIERDDSASRGLPRGPVRVFEPAPGGELALVGESELAGAAEPTRTAAGTELAVDTIALGTAASVVGHRERRDWARDDVRRRFSEEFLITIDNARPRPIDVVIREHLYRGQSWTLAYRSAPATRDGPQQIALRAAVPAYGRAKVLYVVVYTW